MKTTVKMATVYRPGDVGIELPPGASAQQLAPADYHPIEMEPAQDPRAPRLPRRAPRARR